MPRYFAERDPGDPRFAVLKEEEMHHAATVMRMRPGEKLTLIVDRALYACVFTGEKRLELGEQLPGTEPDLSVTLFQGIPKADKMEWICQKATECGADAVVPVSMCRCVSRWDARAAVKKTERLQRIAQEAAKQSGRAMVPDISLPLTPEEMAARFGSFDQVLCPWEEAEGPGPKTYWESAAVRPKRIAVVIGPEGGIDRTEMDMMRAKGALPITLGPRIFRTETAGVAVICALMALSGNME